MTDKPIIKIKKNIKIARDELATVIEELGKIQKLFDAKDVEIERLRAEISHMKDAARRTRPFLSEYDRSTPF